MGDRILAFLRDLPVDGLVYMDAWPFEATQDGIAQALGISRAHAALELKRLLARGLAEVTHAHVRDGKLVRKVYRVNPNPMTIFDEAGTPLPIVQGDLSTLEVVVFRCPTCSKLARVALKK